MKTHFESLDSIEHLDLNTLIIPAPGLPCETRLDDAALLMAREDREGLAVLEGDRVAGICTRKRIATLFGVRYGHALYARSEVINQVEEHCQVVCIEWPLLEILQEVFGSEECSFHQDVVVVDCEGQYLGLFEIATLARLQSRLLEEKAQHAEDRSERVEAANQLLREMAERLRGANRDLKQARDESLQAARSKSEFLAVMSHEIRTPLNGVLGMLGLLAETQLSEEQRELTTTANDSAEALLLILNDILDFSRLDAGKIELDPHSFSVRELAESVLTLMAESAQEQDLDVVCDIDQAVPESVVSDSGRIRQILSNIIGNAVKFTEKGEIVFSIAVADEEGSADRYLRFEVSDTGIGIGKEAQASLFNPFAQADKSTTRLFGGTGLGLAICKKLVNAMGGQIGVESEPGKGSTFWFTIPCCKVGECCAGYSPQRFTEGTRALVAVANPRIALAIGKEFAARNIQSVIAYTHEDAARELAEENDFGLVVVEDLFWREGVKALCREELPVAVVYATHGNRPEERGGRIAALSKPIRPSSLDRVLDKLLREKPAAVARAQSCCEPEGASECGATERIFPEEGPSILLVEDHAVNRRLMELMLRKLGHRCDVAVDGVEALERCAERDYALILLDCCMPRMDGYEFVRILRDREKDEGAQRRSRVIALTANAMQGDRELCLASGMDDYLSKPVKKNLLSEVLGQLFGKVSPQKA